eukprot:6006426-Amphidinium_carterae.1
MSSLRCCHRSQTRADCLAVRHRHFAHCDEFVVWPGAIVGMFPVDVEVAIVANCLAVARGP